MLFHDALRKPGSQLTLRPGSKKSEFLGRKHSPIFEYTITLEKTRTVRVCSRMFDNIARISGSGN